MKLNHDEIKRYSRHLIMPEVGMKGQEKLKDASVLIIGAGGLGCPLSLYLAAAGIGKIGLVDFDTIDFSNLQRQVIYNTDDVGKYKADVAAAKIKAMNPNMEVEVFKTAFTSANAHEISAGYDILIDGTDNFPTRYLVNDLAVISKRPNVFGSVFRFDGQVTVFDGEKGPCYRCLYPDPPPPGMVPNCAEGGVLGVLPGIVGVAQATEAIKIITGNGDPLIGRLLSFDALAMKFRELKIRKDPDCSVCGPNPSVTELIDYEHFCGVGIIDSAADALPEVLPEKVKSLLDQDTEPFLLDVRNPHEWDICMHPKAVGIPLPELADRFDEVPKDREIITICHKGGRSKTAQQLLADAGYENVINMKGGMDLWAVTIDPEMPRY
jgi:molybdopterin/thiamine biosynthesis adenylyltransferase/rhodanese-related sulfurtransferase